MTSTKWIDVFAVSLCTILGVVQTVFASDDNSTKAGDTTQRPRDDKDGNGSPAVLAVVVVFIVVLVVSVGVALAVGIYKYRTYHKKHGLIKERYKVSVESPEREATTDLSIFDVCGLPPSNTAE